MDHSSVNNRLREEMIEMEKNTRLHGLSGVTGGLHYIPTHDALRSMSS